MVIDSVLSSTLPYKKEQGSYPGALSALSAHSAPLRVPGTWPGTRKNTERGMPSERHKTFRVAKEDHALFYVTILKSCCSNTRSACSTVSLDKKASGDPGECAIRAYTKWYDTST
jgi:hypothetical protein